VQDHGEKRAWVRVAHNVDNEEVGDTRMRHRTDVAGPTTKETLLTDCSLSPSNSCDEVQNYKDTCAKRSRSVLMNKGNDGSEGGRRTDGR